MKRINSYFIALLAISALAACNRETENLKEEIIGSEEVTLVPFDIKAGGETITEETKAIISSAGTQIFWESSDKLGVFDGVAKREFTTTADGTSSSSNFSGQVAEGATNLIAVYPAEAGVSYESNILTAIVPKEQIVPAGKNIAQNAIVSVGKVESGALALKTTVAIVKVRIERPDVKAVIVEGSNIAGTAKFSIADGSVSEVTAGENKVILKYSGGNFDTGNYYIALLPGTTSTGNFKVSIECEKCNSEILSSVKDVTLARNTSLDFTALESTIAYKYVITTAEELLEWGEIAALCKTNDIVELGADIDLNRASWTPRNFKGIFDGKNHKIYNFKVSSTNDYAGFFKTLSGTLKNTVFGSSDGVNYDGFSVYELGYDVNNKNWMYAGLISRVDQSGSISNVKNFAKVHILGSNITKFRAGAIVGNWTSTGSITNAENYGEVIAEDCPQGLKDSGDPEFNVIGGVVAWADNAPSQFEGNNNLGKITNHCKYVKYFGGVFGCSGSAVFTIKNCINSGELIDDAERTTDIWMAGILGRFNAAGTLDACENRGNITFTGSATYSNVAGILAYTNLASTTKGCINTGKITVNPVDGGQHRVGGVVAMISSAPKSVTENCTNRGEIKVNLQTSATNRTGNIGGVVAYIKGKDESNTSIIRNCYNHMSGKIEVYGGITGTAYVGGVCGNSAQFSYLNESLVNEAEIHVHDSQRTFQIGGIAGYAYHTWDASFSSGANSYNKGNITATQLANISGKTHCIGGAFGYSSAEYRKVKLDANITAVGKDGASIAAGLAVGQSGNKSEYKFHHGSFKGTVSASVETGGSDANVYAGILYGSFKDASTPDTRILKFGYSETLVFDPSITVNGTILTTDNIISLSIGNPNGTPAVFEADPGKTHQPYRIDAWSL